MRRQRSVFDEGNDKCKVSKKRRRTNGGFERERERAIVFLLSSSNFCF